MNLLTEKINDVCVVHVNEKRVDFVNCDEFREELLNLITVGNKNIIINLNDVDYMTSGGLGAIVASYKLLHGKGDIVIYGYNEVISNLLTVSGLRNYIITAISQKEALEKLKK
jgi:anti-anti-sigma factor